MLDSNIDAVKNKFAESNPYSAVYIHPSAEVTDKMFVYVLLTGLAAPLDEMNALCDEVSELIAKDKEIVKKNRKALKGLHSLSIYDDSDDDDEDDYVPRRKAAVGSVHYDFASGN